MKARRGVILTVPRGEDAGGILRTVLCSRSGVQFTMNPTRVEEAATCDLRIVVVCWHLETGYLTKLTRASLNRRLDPWILAFPTVPVLFVSPMFHYSKPAPVVCSLGVDLLDMRNLVENVAMLSRRRRNAAEVEPLKPAPLSVPAKRENLKSNVA